MVETTIDQEIIDHLHAVVIELDLRSFRDPVSSFEYASELVDEGMNGDTRFNAPPDVLSIPLSPAPDQSTVEKLLLLRFAGVSLSDAVIARIGSTVTRLKNIIGEGVVEFWGKVLTNGKKDYYICRSDSGGESNLFFAVGQKGNWTQIRPVDHDLVRASMSLSYVFTGEPDSSVMDSSGRLFGSELDYLAAVIHRIDSSTCIGPALTEDNRLVPSIHCHEYVGLAAFRHMRDSDTADDPEGVRLCHGALDRDRPGSWTIRYFGDPNKYLNEVDDQAEMSLGRVRISSQVWPGFHYVVSGYLNETASVYLGNGIQGLLSNFDSGME